MYLHSALNYTNKYIKNVVLFISNLGAERKKYNLEISKLKLVILAKMPKSNPQSLRYTPSPYGLTLTKLFIIQ